MRYSGRRHTPGLVVVFVSLPNEKEATRTNRVFPALRPPIQRPNVISQVSGVVTLLKALTWSATFAVMFAGAVRVGPGSLRRVRDQPGLFARTLLAVWILVPVLTILVVLALDVRGLSATMLLLMAVCPGLPALLDWTRTVRGSMTTALLALLLTAATEPFVIPYWTRILSVFHPLDLRVPARDVLAVLLPTVFLPVLLGFALRTGGGAF